MNAARHGEPDRAGCDGPGRVLSVEREGTQEIEVSVRTRDARHIEIELDGALHVVEVEDEDPRDE